MNRAWENRHDITLSPKVIEEAEWQAFGRSVSDEFIRTGKVPTWALAPKPKKKRSS